MGPRVLNFGSNQHLAGDLYMHVDEIGQKKFLKGKDMTHSGMLRFSFLTCPSVPHLQNVISCIGL